MRKLLFLIIFMMSLLFPAKAGFFVRGITVNDISYNNLMNYTLSFNSSGNPIAAATMSENLSSTVGRDCIVIIDQASSSSIVFTIPIDPGHTVHDIEVRDFQKVEQDLYLICGSRRVDLTERAFVAVLTSNFNSMQFYEYTNASIFYSIWVDSPNYPSPLGNFYICGTSDTKGVFGHIDLISMQFTNFFITKEDWEYHKIIVKRGELNSQTFVISGRNHGNSRIGFSTIHSLFNPSSINTYIWEQYTNPDSHCVVADCPNGHNTIVIGSSFRDIVTLNPVAFPISPLLSIDAIRFTMSGEHNLFDIGIFNRATVPNIHISLAGYARGEWGGQTMAWYGDVTGLSSTSPMDNKYYYRTENERLENYKVRPSTNLIVSGVFTGGYFEDDNLMGALYGAPLYSSPEECEKTNTISPYVETIHWDSFTVLPDFSEKHIILHTYTPHSMLNTDYCDPFKGGGAPDFAMTPPEKESEITNFYDRITIKDVPAGTYYQIYSVTGQLLLSGTINPDISTAQLSKGMYILRLENGKAYKFVK